MVATTNPKSVWAEANERNEMNEGRLNEAW